MENEVISLNLCKEYLRIDSDTDNNLLNSIIEAVVSHTEDYLKLDIKRRNNIVTYYNFTGSKIAPKNANNLQVNSIFYQLFNDSPLQKFDNFLVNNNIIYMAEIMHIKKLIINYDSGYEIVPEPIKIGMLEHIATIYDGDQGDLPSKARSLFHPYKQIIL